MEQIVKRMQKRIKPRPLAGSVRNRATHAAIIEAAIAILNERGYGGFTIDAVARRCGAGKPTIYRWWKSKSELFMELYNRESAAMMPVEDLGSIRAELIAQIKSIFDFWRTTACGRAFRGMIAESQADARSLAQLRDQFLPPRRNLARTILERAQRRGELAGDKIGTALDLLYGFSIYHLITDQLQDGAAIEAMVDLLVQGLAGGRDLPTADQIIDHPQRLARRS
ncbi:MAG: TetR/AcrR family transcriptional regulator [Xanthobacteraceae bacterium]|nr:TetR/AcrR family transcriptional regulator [Xanthobacteraceae bacterium]